MSVGKTVLQSTLVRFIAWTMLGCTLLPAPLQAEPANDLLQQIKSAFVFNIAKFVQWPDASDKDPIQLCHYRINTLPAGFGAIAGKTIQGRIMDATAIAGLEHSDPCDILFIPRDQLNLFNAEQWRIQEHAILTIADLTALPAKRQVESRAIINLVRQGSRVGLEINLPVLQANPLHISSELLKLARVRR